MNKEQQIQIKADDNLIKGRYSNNLMISHNKEEFIMDFLTVFPPQGSLVSRVVTSPGHMKRILKAMEENIKLYEDKFGRISESEGHEGAIGFKP